MTTITKDWLYRNDFWSWIKDKYYLPNGQKYSFKGYEYLEDIAKRQLNPGDQIYGRKSAQCGYSELAIAWCLWLLHRELDPPLSGVGYVFPSKTHLNDHMKARVFPLLESKEHYDKVTNSNLGLITYNRIPWYFRPSNTRALKSWPAGAAVIDEFDEFEDPISIIPTIEARFNASDYGWIFGLSTPTHPDIGIDKAVAISNQYHWRIACPKCSKKFFPLEEVISSGFENCVVWDDNWNGPERRAMFLCPHCNEGIQTPGLPGEWELTKTQPNQKYSYSISKLFLAKTQLGKLLASFEEALNLQEFYNSDLGLPYSPPNARLSRRNIREASIGDMETKAVSAQPTWMGIDVGKPCHYMIGLPGDNGTKKVIAYGTCKLDQVEDIIKRYNVKTMVIDLRPEENSVKNLIRGRRGFYACDFNTGNQVDWYNVIRSDSGILGTSSKILKAERTQSCDKIIESIAIQKKMVFPGKAKGDENLISQMCSPMRIDGVDKKTGDVRSYYKSSSRKDHFFFACVYLNLAFNLRKGCVAKIGNLLL